MSSYLSEWDYTKVLRELYEEVDVAIVGDSHVRRFKDFTSSRFNQEIGFTPDLGGFEEVRSVRYFGFGGAHTSGILNRVRRGHLLADLVRPTVVILLVGGNNLCGQASYPWEVADLLISLAEQISALPKVVKVVIGGQFPRAAPYAILPSYNDRVGSLNQWVKATLEGRMGGDVSFWAHNGLRDPVTVCSDDLRDDLVHLNHQSGNKKLWESLRSCVIHSLNH